VCRSFYSDSSQICGTGLSSNYEGQIMHQPAWSLFDAIKLAGIEPSATGYSIAPHLPFARFSVRFPDIGLAYERRRVRGYLVLQQRGSLRLDVQVPASARAASLVTWVNGRRVAHSLAGRTVRFRLSGRARAPIDWAITWGRRG